MKAAVRTVPRSSPPAVRTLSRPASAHALLGINGRHQLYIEARHLMASLDRDAVSALSAALTRVDDADAVALMSVFKPGVRLADVKLLRRALEAFVEELAFEDGRSEPRAHRTSKVLDV